MQVVLATARPYLCQSLCLYFSTCDVDVVGTADTVASLLATTSRVGPDIVLLDTELAGGFLEVTMDALKATDKSPAIVLLNRPNGPDLPDAAARADGQSVIGDPPETLLALLSSLRPTDPGGADAGVGLRPSSGSSTVA